MQLGPATRWLAAASVGVVLAAGAVTAGSPAASAASGSAANAPGVTSNQVQVGALATLSGPLAADFGAIVPGVRAYLDMVNAHGGVYGRKIVLAHVYDDGSQATQDADLARTLVEQDHVFAVVGVGTAFFAGAQFLASTGTPTFGFVTESDWAPARNMFGAGGSILNYDTTEPFFAYVAKKLGATSAGTIAYGVPQSADECQTALDGFSKYGVHVGYSDNAVDYGSDLSSEVLHMKSAGVDFIVSCMDETGNIALSRTLEEYGMTDVRQLWLDGYDRSELKQYSSLMQHTYFSVQHVPFEAYTQFPGAYPGLDLYLKTMAKYEPADAYSEVALQGWVSAALFVAGLRAAGPHPTQAAVVKDINHIPAFTAGGLTTPVDWELGHTVVTSPGCQAFVETVGSTFKVVFNHGTKIFVCFPVGKKADLNAPVPAPAGTPGG